MSKEYMQSLTVLYLPKHTLGGLEQNEEKYSDFIDVVNASDPYCRLYVK